MKKIINKVGIICDVGPNVGFGHIRRMSLLQKEFTRKNFECSFIFDVNMKSYLSDIKFKHLSIFYKRSLNNSETYSIGIVAKEHGISIIIIDSYKFNKTQEQELSISGFFTVAIDDHLKRHNTNLIFTNKPEQERKYCYTKSQIWFMGPEYALIDCKKNIFNYKSNIKTILLHCGGTSKFNQNKEFTRSVISLNEKYDIQLSILCTDNRSKNFIEKEIKNLNAKNKVKILNYTTDLSSKLKQFDVVAGPSGTTTFETILSGAMPFSFQLKKDTRDSLNSWNNLGHLLHFDFNEKKDLKLLEEAWDFLFENQKRVTKILKNNTQTIDNNGASRIVKNILIFYKDKERISNHLEYRSDSNNQEFFSHKCIYGDMRNFLSCRNQLSVREMSTDPEHIINWIEHINWWLTRDIKKFKITRYNKDIGYHWIKTNKDKFGEYITSGWFLFDSVNDRLKVAFEILKFQILYAQKNFKGNDWVIIMKKKNKFVERINKNCGFKKARKLSSKRAAASFGIGLDNYTIMEMKL